MTDEQRRALEAFTDEELSIAAIRTLAMDAVQKANSGHPGTAMALAPLAYTLWQRFLRHNPANPDWFNRDRFVLSAGHASILQYSMLHLTGYDLPLEELQNFRQWGSRTPGHPEYGHTAGVETTTGPLGQGIMTAVGMAMAEAHTAAVYNRPDHPVVDHHTYVIASDGDMMEGASHEAASLAGHLRLGKLIVFYDDNRITIDGESHLASSEEVNKRFEAYGWHVQDLGEQANEVDALSEAIERAQADERPSLIMLRTYIAYGAPNLQGTPQAHGAPLGEEEVRLTKRAYGWPEDAHFLVPDQVREHMQRPALEQGRAAEAAWQKTLDAYRQAYPDLARQFDAARQDKLPANWDEILPRYEGGESQIATRAAGGEVLNRLAEHIPWLMGGAADLASSTKAEIKNGGDFERGNYTGRNVRWGIREHVMCAACSGMALHGGIRPFASTFLIFTDYARPAIRLAALMKQPVIYVMTHDSIALGGDGPTHQPVEHLASLRAMPELCVIRPADANETAFAWQAALSRQHGPTILVLSRQNLPVLARERLAGADGVLRGAYVLSAEQGERPELILMATGSEVHLALAAQGELATQHQVDARVVSMPSWELFQEQPADYRDTVLPPDVKARLAIEAASPFGWRDWVGDAGGILAVARFGASASGNENLERYGFTVDNAINHALQVLETVRGQ